MNIFFNLSIRRTLLLLFLVIIFPFLVITIYSTYQNRAEAIENSRQRTLQLVETVVAEQRIKEASTRQLLSTLAKLPEFQQGNVKKCTDILFDLSKQNSMYANLFLADKQGNVIASAQSFKTSNVSHRKYFLEVLKIKDFSVGEYVVGNITKKPSLHYAYPIMDRKNVLKGILVAAVDLDHYEQLFKKSHLPQGSNLAITDHKGVRLFRYPVVKETVGQNDLQEMMSFMSGTDEKGTFFNIGVDGIKRLYAFSRISLRDQDPPYLFIRAGIPEVLALEGANELLKRNLFSIGLAILASIYFAWHLGNIMFVRRLERLNAFAGRVQKGEIGVRTSVPHTQDELGMLASSFDDMATAIEERDREKEQAHRRLNKIIEFLPDATFVIDADRKVIAWNKAIEQMTGVLKGDMIGKGNYEYAIPFYGERRPVIIDLVFLSDEVFESGNYDAVSRSADRFCGEAYVPKTYGGKGAYLSLTASRLCDNLGNIIGAIESIRDITDRKLAEKARWESEELFRSLFNTINDAVFLHHGPDPDGLPGKFIEVNDIACKRLGYSRDELLRMSPLDIDAPDTVEAVPLIREKLDKDKQAIWEGAHVARDGKRIPVEINNRLIDFKGIPAILSTVRDITERKAVEAERGVLEKKLFQAQKMEAIGTLAGGIAHDFNNLLMGIQGYASLTLLNLDPSHPNYERLTRIEDQVQSGANLTRQLLGFARGGRYEVKPADMNEIIKKTSSMFGRTKKEISIQRKYGKDLFAVEVDQGQMEQVFMNLYVNAWQAMHGGGEICLETENIVLDDEHGFPHAVKPGRYVKVSITDTGIGMDEKTRERIFDPFFTTKAMGRGTGLGLAMVYGIIKGHGGMIDVTSEPGHGTTFNIYFPATEKTIVKEKTAPSKIMKGKETILLVDDEQMTLEVSKELLESMGYRVYAVGSGQEAIAVYLEKRSVIDLVILDMIMPGISGEETFDRLREINSKAKVLLSSGYSLNGKAQTIMDRGCNGFLQKPFQLSELSGKVREVLE